MIQGEYCGYILTDTTKGDRNTELL